MVGILSSIFFIMPLFISVFIGKISDKHGRGKIIILGILISLIGLLIFHYASISILLIAGMIVISIEQSILFPMSIALQGDIATKNNQTVITNFFIFFKYFGMIFGVVLGDTLGMEWAYLVTIVIFSMILLFSFGILLDEKKLKEKILEETFKKHL